MSPLADPLASSSSADRARHDRASLTVTPTKDLRPRRRLSPRQLVAISAQLTSRDREALQLVARFRVMSGAQLRELLWSTIASSARPRLARRGLARLVHLGVLTALARRVGGERAGSASTTFAVGRAGQHLLQAQGAERKRVRQPHTPGARYLAHALAVGDLYVALTETRRRGAIELTEFAPEPECWRTYLQGFGARQVLKPDCFLKLATADYWLSWFVEIDLATEALTTIRAKADRYYDYYRTGGEQSAHGVFPRVLWIVPDTARAEAIGDALAHLPEDAQRLFAVASVDQAVALITSEDRP